MENTIQSQNINIEGEIKFTEAAIAEAQRLINQEENPGGLMLRLGIQPGGCSGLSYMMSFTRKVGEFDKIFDFRDVKVIVDAKSLAYLDGTTVDFDKELLSGGFKFDNPRAARGCGCGTSFSV